MRECDALAEGIGNRSIVPAIPEISHTEAQRSQRRVRRMEPQMNTDGAVEASQVKDEWDLGE